MYRLLLIISLLFSLARFSFGQSTGVTLHTTDTKIDTNYIQDLTDKLVIRSFFKTKSNSLDFKSGKTKLIYKPNPSTNMGVGFNYDWLGVNVAFKLPKNKAEQEKYGKTKSLDIQANMYMRKYVVDFSYIKYRGYYLQDNLENINGKKRDSIFQNSSLRTHSLAMSVNYIFNNKRFSYRAAFLQNEKQLKSAGTAFVGGYVSSIGFASKDSLIPQHQLEKFQEIANISRGRSLQIGGQGGYAHTFVWRHFYFTLSGGIGLGLERRKFFKHDDNVLVAKYGIAPHAQVKGAIGYNSHNLTIGFQGVTDGYLVGQSGDNEVAYNFGSFRLFGAYRINAPKQIHFLKKLKPFGRK